MHVVQSPEEKEVKVSKANASRIVLIDLPRYLEEEEEEEESLNPGWISVFTPIRTHPLVAFTSTTAAASYY